jgi:hypothetical protein
MLHARVILAGMLILTGSAISPCLADPFTTLNVRVSASADDAGQSSAGVVNIGNSGIHVGTMSWVGIRFKNITIPRNATIISAVLTFRSDGNYSTYPAACTMFAEASDNSAGFTTAASSISSRARTTASYSVPVIPAYTLNTDLPAGDVGAMIQEVVDRSGWNSGNSLSVIIRSDAAGQRGAFSYDGSTAYAPLLTIQYTPYPRPVAPNLLYVVTNVSSPTAQELKREEWLKWWAYKVTRIVSTDSQANFTAAAAANDVAFVPEQVTSADLNTKLKSAALGVVTDEPALLDDFGLSTILANTSASTFALPVNTHYITAPFSPGTVTLFSSTPPSLEPAAPLAPEAVTLGTFSSNVSGLVTMEAGGTLIDGTKAAGRRVFVPWSAGTDYNLINSNGQTMLRRSLEWAAGLQSWWKLDETSGSTAVDSGIHARNGTLNGTTFAAGTIPARLGNGLSLDGASTYVSVPNHATLQLTNALSISGWIYLNSFGNSSDVDIVLRKGDTAPAAYQLCIQDGKVTMHLNETDGTSAGTFGMTALSTGKWHHVAATWDGTTSLVYLDGYADSGPRAISGALPLDTRSLYMGGRINVTDLVSGKLDDVRLYNYALTAAEVFNLRRINQARGMRIVKWVETQ